MVKRNNIPINKEPDCNCPPPMYPIPDPIAFGVNSINGLQGDVVLKNLIVGNKQFNGSSDVEITADDLGLLKAVKYVGSKTRKQIDALTDVPVGNLYFCTDDKLYYLSVGEGDWRHWLSGDGLKQEIADRKAGDEALQLEIDEIKLSIEEILQLIDVHDGRITALELNSEHTSEELERIFQILDAHGDDISELKIKVQNLEFRQVTLDRKVTDLSNWSEVTDDRLDTLESDVSSIHAEISTINSEISEINSSIEDLVEQGDIYGDAITDLKIKVQNLEHRQVTLDRKVTDLTNLVESYGSRITNVESEVALNSAKIIEHESKISQNESDISNIEQDVSRIDNSLDIVSDDVSDIKIKVQNLEHRQVTLDRKVTDIVSDLNEIKSKVNEIPVIKQLAEEASQKAEDAEQKANYAKGKVDDLAIKVGNLEYRQVVTDHRLETLEHDQIKKITAVDKVLTVDDNNNITLPGTTKSKYGLVKLGDEFIEDDILTLNEVSTDKIVQGTKSILLQAVDE